MSLFKAAEPLEELCVSSISSEGCSMSLGISQTRVRKYRSGVTYLSNQGSSSSTDCRAARRPVPAWLLGGRYHALPVGTSCVSKGF